MSRQASEFKGYSVSGLIRASFSLSLLLESLDNNDKLKFVGHPKRCRAPLATALQKLLQLFAQPLIYNFRIGLAL